MRNREVALRGGREKKATFCVFVWGGVFSQRKMGPRWVPAIMMLTRPCPPSFWGRICRVPALQGEEIHRLRGGAPGD